MVSLLLMCKLNLITVLFKMLGVINLIILFMISGLNIYCTMKQLK